MLRVKMLPEQGPLIKSKTLGENLSSYCCQIIHMFCVLFILAYIRYCMILSLWPPATHQSQFPCTLSWNFSLVLVLLFNYNNNTDYLYFIFWTFTQHFFCIFYLYNIFSLLRIIAGVTKTWNFFSMFCKTLACISIQFINTNIFQEQLISSSSMTISRLFVIQLNCHFFVYNR